MWLRSVLPEHKVSAKKATVPLATYPFIHPDVVLASEMSGGAVWWATVDHMCSQRSKAHRNNESKAERVFFLIRMA